jgi:hypothetical protein
MCLYAQANQQQRKGDIDTILSAFKKDQSISHSKSVNATSKFCTAIAA